MSYTINYSPSAGKYLIETPTKGVKRKLKRTREYIGYAIKDYLKKRIRNKGMGANGPLKGYSTKPFYFKKSNKPMWNEDDFEGTVVQGGYKAYRETVGIPSGHFMFQNKGNAWNDWDFNVDNITGSVLIGFNDPANAEAAKFAMEDGRLDMFELNDAELNKILDGIIDTFERELIGEI